MSTQPEPKYVEDELSEETVCDYLESHPDFFERNAQLLGSLRLPHETGGTVSLVERQVSMLRQKEIKLERQLRDLIDVARDNDILVAKIHELTMQLLATRDLDATISAVEEAMRSGFDADHAVLVHFGDPDNFKDVRAGRFFRAVKRDEAALAPFATFLKSSSDRAAARFAMRSASSCSAVMRTTWGRWRWSRWAKKRKSGFSPIGSVDADRFHPGMSIDFLSRVGDLVAGALKRF